MARFLFLFSRSREENQRSFRLGIGDDGGNKPSLSYSSVDTIDKSGDSSSASPSLCRPDCRINTKLGDRTLYRSVE